MKVFSKCPLTMLKECIYVCACKDSRVRVNPALKWSKIKGNLTLILEGEYNMISLAYKVRAGVVSMMVNSNMIVTQYDGKITH